MDMKDALVSFSTDLSLARMGAALKAFFWGLIRAIVDFLVRLFLTLAVLMILLLALVRPGHTMPLENPSAHVGMSYVMTDQLRKTGMSDQQAILTTMAVMGVLDILFPNGNFLFNTGFNFAGAWAGANLHPKIMQEMPEIRIIPRESKEQE